MMSRCNLSVKLVGNLSGEAVLSGLLVQVRLNFTGSGAIHVVVIYYRKPRVPEPHFFGSVPSQLYLDSLGGIQGSLCDEISLPAITVT